MSIIDRKPSFFRKGGLLLLGHDDRQRLEVGRSQDGSWYIEILGKNHARAILTPKQMEDLADGVLKIMGLTYDTART